ncbi:MAG: hypothetical protein ACW98Y_18565, partial [Candidatus Thorarchaeota archaeon]
DLHLIITMNGSTVFETVTPSVSGLHSIQWTPSQRGIAIIVLNYDGDSYILANSVQSSLSAIEQVNAVLFIVPSSIDLGNSTEFTYELQDTADVEGVDIQFEVLDVNLVPIWSSIVTTNSTGHAVISFSAIDVIGVLTVQAAPVDPQLVGGNVQGQVIVMTSCTATSTLSPAPASIGGSLNISVECRDDLGGMIDGLSVRISLFYMGQPIRLGLFTDWITLTTINGIAWVEFTPEYAGSYQVVVDSSGSAGVHSFYLEDYHIVHNPTSLEFVTLLTDIEVGEDLHVVALLTNYFGDPLVGRTVTLTVDTLAGPIDLVTNDTGHVDWYAQLNHEGLWEVSAQFDGVGVYLPSSQLSSVDVRYGTRIYVSRTDNSTIIAGTTSLSVAVLLEDSGGSPLEGRTVEYQVYHDDQGLLYEGSFIQIGQTAEIIDISLDRYGNHTILFLYTGTVHYHPSSTALSIFVVGTSELLVSDTPEVNRAVDNNITIMLFDELGLILDPSAIQLDLALDGTSLDIANRVIVNATKIDILLKGLQVGQYTLNASLVTTSSRIGSTISLSFNVTAQSTLSITDSELSGLVGQSHSVTLYVSDSLSDAIEDAFIYISVFDPDGAEIFGSLLTTRSLVVTSLGYAEIDWTPSKTGNYTLLIEYEGTDYIGNSTLTIIVLARYETHMDVSLPELLVFPNSGRLMVTLSGGVGKVSDAELVVQLLIDESVVQEIVLMTDVRGLAQTDLIAPYAGNYSVSIVYVGSDRYMDTMHIAQLIVEPVADLEFNFSQPLYVGVNGSILIELDIQGVSPDWTGLLHLSATNPDGSIVGSGVVDVNWNSTVEAHIFPNLEGEYTIYVEISELPIIGQLNFSAEFYVTVIPFSSQMDVSTVPILSGGAVLGVIGLILRKRLGGALDSLSVEWDA